MFYLKKIPETVKWDIYFLGVIRLLVVYDYRTTISRITIILVNINKEIWVRVAAS